MKFLFALAALGVMSASAQQSTSEGHNTLYFAPGAKVPVASDQSSAPERMASAHKDDPAAIIDLFFLSLKANQVDAAYDALVKNTIVADKQEDVTGLKGRTKQALDNYGPISGYEVVDDQLVGTVLMRKTCISFNTDLPLRWRFYFYKSGGVWRLVDLGVDDGVSLLFDDSAKAKK